MITVRPPYDAEIDTMIDMGEQFWRMTKYANIAPYNKKDVRLTCEQCAAGNLFFGAYDGDKIAGFIAGLKAPIYANHSVFFGQELFWWVEPQYRNQNVGKLLMDAIEQEAKNQGLAYWTMMYLVNIEPEKAKSIYLSRGYVETEIGFSKEL